MTTIQILINWERLHATAKAVDAVRGQLGRDGCFDAFGGSYFADHYEARGLAGLHLIACEANKIRHAAWHAIHGAASEAVAALVLRDQDGAQAWWSVACEGRKDMQHRSRRGARYRASRYGGKAELRAATWAERQRQDAAQKRHAAVIDRCRRAVETALALHELYLALAETGIIEYSPQSEICGATDTLQVTGLRWLAGERQESDRGPSVAAAKAFVLGGIEALRAAI
jgi:hypothetical protein